MNKLFRLRNVFVTLDGVLQGLVPNDKRDETVAPLTMHSLGEVMKRYIDHVNEGDFKADDFFNNHSTEEKFLEIVARQEEEDTPLTPLLGKLTNTRTILLAMHEYQHRYHEDDDDLLDDNGRSLLEAEAWDIAGELCNKLQGIDVDDHIFNVYDTYANMDVSCVAEIIYGLSKLRNQITKVVPEVYLPLIIGGN